MWRRHGKFVLSSPVERRLRLPLFGDCRPLQRILLCAAVVGSGVPPMPSKTAKSPYDVHPGVKMVQDWIACLKQKTGRTLEEWIELVQQSGPPTAKERREWLKAAHKLGTNGAWWIADRA